MKSNRIFLIILSMFALSLIVILAISFSKKKDFEEESADEIEYTKNILLNGNFEKEDLIYWKFNLIHDNKYFHIIDNIVKFEGKQSLNLTSDSEDRILSISQLVKEFPIDNKLILNGKVRTENAEATFLSIQLFSYEDSLIVEACSDTLRGTNDWTHLTTWVRTINTKISYIKVSCNLFGKGRAWFDKLELYPVEIKQKNIFPLKAIPFK